MRERIFFENKKRSRENNSRERVFESLLKLISKKTLTTRNNKCRGVLY